MSQKYNLTKSMFGTFEIDFITGNTHSIKNPKTQQRKESDFIFSKETLKKFTHSDSGPWQINVFLDTLYKGVIFFFLLFHLGSYPFSILFFVHLVCFCVVLVCSGLIPFHPMCAQLLILLSFKVVKTQVREISTRI